MTARKMTWLLLLALFVALTTTGVRAKTVESNFENAGHVAQPPAQSGGLLDILERIKELQSQQLEGSWEVIVTPAVPPGVPQPPSFHVYSTFSRGGGYTGSDRTRPFSKQHGVWEHLGGNSFAGTAKEDLFDALGNFVGILTVRTRTTVTGKDTFIGVANGELRDAAGNITRSVCTTFRGTRLKVEPLPEQCQNIPPPQ